MKTTELKNCPVCDTYHDRYGKTCSSECARTANSMARRAQEAAKRGETEWKPGPRYERNLDYWARNPEKRAAHIRVTTMRRKMSHDQCNRCGATDTRIELHHWSYQPEHTIEVEPLCCKCHAYADMIRKWASQNVGLNDSTILFKSWKLAPAFSAHQELVARMVTTDKLSRKLARAKDQEAKKLETFNARVGRL